MRMQIGRSHHPGALDHPTGKTDADRPRPPKMGDDIGNGGGHLHRLELLGRRNPVTFGQQAAGFGVNRRGLERRAADIDAESLHEGKTLRFLPQDVQQGLESGQAPVGQPAR